ncbi:MFS general substrate transporter [Thozetella sp. PMI_491]|nr:MFS general substrate transporter [Thozetella sp. PMI_491]
MSNIARILSRPTAKPYRTHDLRLEDPPTLNDDGHLDFSPGDIENPMNWSIARRSYITVCSVLLVTTATFASSSPSGCFRSISQEFDVSLEVTGLTITVFLLGYCAGPLIFAPLSEFYGRRYVFYVSFFCFLAFTLLCAFAPDFGALLVGRFLAGTFVSAPLTNAPGVLADLLGPVARSNALAAFSCMVWVGPALGPVISGFLEMTKDWRWSFYVTLWLGGVAAVLMLTIPETYAPIVLKNKAQRIRRARLPGFENVKAPIEDTDRSLVGLYKVALTRPWVILFDPISFLCALYMSVVYLLLYMLFSIYPIIFQEKRGWNAGVGELPLLGTVVGAMLGAVVVVVDSRRQQRLIDTGVLEPEDRLFIAMGGGIAFAACNFWLAWAGEYTSVHWIVPTLAGVFLTTAMMLIFVSYLSYLVDTYLLYAASALAANTVVRSAVASAAPLFTNQMFTALGVGGGGSLVGGVACLLAIIPFCFYWWGKQIRTRSRFAPNPQRPSVQDEEKQGTEALGRQAGLRPRSDGHEARRSASAAADTGSTSGGESQTGLTSAADGKKEDDMH